MPTSARVAVVPEGSGPIRIESVSLPDPQPDQVVVKLFSSGICHSQLHEMHGPRESDIVLGHEGTGEVLATTLVDLLGNRTQVRFEDARSDRVPAASWFRFEVPEGVEVIEIRSMRAPGSNP